MKTLRSMLLLCAGTLAFSTTIAQNNDNTVSYPDQRENRRMVRKAEVNANKPGKWIFGPKIGLNASSFSTMPADHRLGPAAGAFVTYNPNENYGIAGDLLLSYKGGEQKMESGNLTMKRNTELGYLEIPVQGMYYFRPGAKFRPKIGLGPYASVLVDSEEVIKTEIDRDGPDPATEDKNDVESYSAFDWGMVGTAGFNYELMGDTWLNVDIRYGHGFSDIAEENGEGDIKNRSWALQVGLGFPLDRE